MLEIIRIRETPLSDKELVDWLRLAREHSHAWQTNFRVSTAIMVPYQGKYYYFLGVNVEAFTNRDSIHSEQNATLLASTMLGQDAVKISEAWLMAAPGDVASLEHPGAGISASSCGHCRQILYEFSGDELFAYGVPWNGEIRRPPDSFSDLIPKPFGKEDVASSAAPAAASKAKVLSTLFRGAPLSPFDLLIAQKKLVERDEFYAYLTRLKPVIRSVAQQTSPVIALILKLENGLCVPGVLVQTAAYLTSSPLFAAYGTAITWLGAGNVNIQEIHCFVSESAALPLNKVLFTGNECQLIHSHLGEGKKKEELAVHCYGETGFQRSITLEDCFRQVVEVQYPRRAPDPIPPGALQPRGDSTGDPTATQHVFMPK